MYSIEEVLNFTVNDIQELNKWFCEAGEAEFTAFDDCVNAVPFEQLHERESEKMA